MINDRQGIQVAKEFRVRIDVDLPAEALDGIERAIQQAVLLQVATLDIADGYSVSMRLPQQPSGGERSAEFADAGSDPVGSVLGDVVTDGIWIREERSIP